jgi:hypothetical protein
MYKKDRQYRINHNALYDNSKNQDENASISLTNSTDGSTAYEHAIIKPIGGGGRHMDVLKLSDITSSIISSSVEHTKFESFEFVDHLEISRSKEQYGDVEFIICNISLHLLVSKLSLKNLHKIGKQHNLFLYHYATKKQIMELFKTHDNDCKHQYVTVFCSYKKAPMLNQSKVFGSKMENIEKQEVSSETVMTNHEISRDIKFPPSPPSKTLCTRIISDFCHATAPENFEEAGCCVCGKLTLCTNLLKLDSVNLNMDILIAIGSAFTRKERKSSTDPISEIDGPIIDKNCSNICKSCQQTVSAGKIPKFALARGLWLGKVPIELQGLSFAEQLLIGRVRHNRCVVRVGKGMHKMIANAITFEHPMKKIYTVLPPPVEELDDVLAFIFTGPCQPTEEDFKRTPLLVRRNKVGKALEWLKINHKDYADLEISYKNLESYPEDTPPVVIDYHHSITNKIAEATSVHNMDLENGTETGICPFTVQTLTGEEYDTTSMETLKAIAAKHLDDGGKVLAIGHAKEPQSIWRNPELYPQMFPWLFPYGLGGIGHERQKYKMSDAEHKKHLLMYH